MKILFARHGETTANVSNVFHGVSDTPLTPRGKELIPALTAFAREQGVTRILTSPLPRCAFMAEQIAASLNIPFERHDLLQEISYGSWELQTHDSLRSSRLWEERKKDPYRFVHPGSHAGIPGESYANQYARIDQLMEELKQGAEQDVVLLIGHKGVHRNVKRYAEGLSEEATYAYEPKNNEVIALTLNPAGEITLTEHLFL